MPYMYYVAAHVYYLYLSYARPNNVIINKRKLTSKISWKPTFNLPSC